MNRKRYIHHLSTQEQNDLTAMLRTSRLHRERQRAQAILWSYEGYDMDTILSLLKVDRDTLSRWYTQWETHGLAGLRDQPRPGRPGKVSAALKKDRNMSSNRRIDYSAIAALFKGGMPLSHQLGYDS